MRITHLRSVGSLDAPDTEMASEDASYLAMRRQAAIVRMLAHELELQAPHGPAESLVEQVVEELARLGRTTLAVTGSRATRPEPSPGMAVAP